MKIILESVQLPETEVIIRGDVAGKEVAAILQAINKKSSGRLFVYREEEQFVLDPSEIVFAEVTENKVSVYTADQSYESKNKLYELKDLLESAGFAKISKSTIVNIACVKSIQAEFSGNYNIKLKNRKEILTLSRKYFKDFKNRI